MKKNLVLIVGIAVLLFAGLAYTGNYVQWASATQVRADVVTAREQWVRRGENSVNVDIKYPVGTDILNGTVNFMASDLEEEVRDGKIEVYYLNKNPERVIPVSVLKGKQRAVPVIAAIGLGLTAFGYYRRTKMRTPAP